MTQRRDLVIGAGPAGLTAAWEFIEAGRHFPLVVEADHQVGGLSRTINHNGNRMDLGGHRFFSKSDWVMDWWLRMLPLAQSEDDGLLTYQQQTVRLSGSEPIAESPSRQCFLVRPRQSRIYFRGQFFDYPVRLNTRLLRNLGLPSLFRIGASYTRSSLFPRQPESNLEDFLVNRFGYELYSMFFRDYTEKVWGVPCREISAEWGAQRIKGLSVSGAIRHALHSIFQAPKGYRQRTTETSLIEQFLYPVHGPGQLWEEVARKVVARGGELKLFHRVLRLEHEEGRVTHALIQDCATQKTVRVAIDQVISTMPLSELSESLTPDAPQSILEIARSLPYRDFMTVGLLVDRMTLAPGRCGVNERGMPPDNWIYIQDPHVRLGRLQIFNNWSPGMVAAHPHIWLGLEYFCRQGDDLWSLEDTALIAFATRELVSIGLIKAGAVLDARVVRVPKAYPAYFGAYQSLDQVKAYLDGFANLFPVGRNGMHRYNNQDHSMLAARCAVETIVGGSGDKSALWSVNADESYHETRQP